MATKKNTDTVPAMLTPGEFVIKRDSAQKIGYDALELMNRTGKVPQQKNIGGKMANNLRGKFLNGMLRGYAKGGMANKKNYQGGGYVDPGLGLDPMLPTDELPVDIKGIIDIVGEGLDERSPKKNLIQGLIEYIMNEHYDPKTGTIRVPKKEADAMNIFREKSAIADTVQEAAYGVAPEGSGSYINNNPGYSRPGFDEDQWMKENSPQGWEHLLPLAGNVLLGSGMGSIINKKYLKYKMEQDRQQAIDRQRKLIEESI